MNSWSCNLDATDAYFKAECGQRGWKQRVVGTQKEKRKIVLGGRTFRKQSYLETVYAASLLPLSGIILISVYFSDTVYFDL